MRVGILTFHFGYNYGAVMQAYALQQYLSNYGYSVKIINYTPPNIKYRPYITQLISRKISVTKVRKIIKKIKYAPRQKDAFELFKGKCFNLSEVISYVELSKITTEYDAIIVGSDQIWNPSQHKLASYFLAHLNNYKGKRISYAPCCAFNKVEDINKLKLQNALNNFDAISVRNKETERFVFELIGKTPSIVVDPTLLWDFKELIEKEPIISGKYILTYILGSEITGGHKKVIDELRKKYAGIKIISVILTENNPQLFNWSDEVFWYASPIEWLNLFYYSTFVYTDSFHGVLFAIKFQKPFLAYYTEMARASRFIDLVNRFDVLQDFIVDSYDEITTKNSFQKEIDFNVLKEKLRKEVEKSNNFLHESLSI
ncbi:Polysaccharide pyruvyl transferase [Tangfeifania diversioriginum]|uniref:Polysaccharide pyruvyl transferase n=1 Tax=Tangfeifania diversioriginum TaxID=1168035 RepID=A0A1M6NNS1_9BACT|nr:polysaccharide pyruvyl transferase family protein [Tangfeifania diversioriginum]SHJ97335.1 Polysaccharide pyruvyl transferase [Tangfeifania diversioriginum]